MLREAELGRVEGDCKHARSLDKSDRALWLHWNTTRR